MWNGELVGGYDMGCCCPISCPHRQRRSRPRRLPPRARRSRRARVVHVPSPVGTCLTWSCTRSSGPAAGRASAAVTATSLAVPGDSHPWGTLQWELHAALEFLLREEWQLLGHAL